jgi:hypothetical protein
MKSSAQRWITALMMALTLASLVLGTAACSDAGSPADPTTATAPTTTTTGDGSATGDPASADPTGGTSTTVAVDYPTPYTVTYDDSDLDDTWSNSTASFITLADGSVRFDGTGASVNGSKVTITAAGTYVISGTVTDGQIVVDLEEKGLVKLVLNGADLTCLSSAPIYIKNASKAVITLAEGTQNHVTDGDSYVLEEDSDEPNAAIFSKEDLTINGSGALLVTANYNHGIVGKDDLKIVSGTITIAAVNDGLKGRDCIGVRDGVITVNAGGDGLQANNDEDPGKGYVDIQGGTLDLTAGEDGIQAETTLLVAAGDLTLTTGGGSANSSGDANSDWGDWGQDRQGGWPGDTTATTDGADADSATDGTTAAASTTAKGLKVAGALFIEGGIISIDSSDDSLHSNNSIHIDGGTVTLTSGDDGIHADTTLEIDGGELTVTKSYEGIESAVITINNGTLHITASDDGINVAGGVDASSISGRRGAGAFTPNENNRLNINGGYVMVDAAGDGIDCNGRMFMTAGTVLINGPTQSMNGALDYLGEFTISGGYLVAAGSTGMAQAPSDSSTQYSVMVNFGSAQPAGTLVHIQDESGADILTFAPAKQYQSVVFSSADIREGATYTVYSGGSSTGTDTDGLYQGGGYTPGTEYATLTISEMVTSTGASGGQMGPGGGADTGGGTRPGGGTFPDDGAVPDDGTMSEGSSDLGGRPDRGTTPGASGGS